MNVFKFQDGGLLPF